MFFDNIFGNKQKKTGERGEELPLDNEGFPDSRLPHGLCTRCNKQSSFDIISTTPISFNGSIYSSSVNGYRDNQVKRDHEDQVTILECRNCHQRMIAIEEKYINDEPKRIASIDGGYISFRGFFWWPLNSLRNNDEIPREIDLAFQEGVTCLAASCPRAAVAMFRRTLEAIVVEKGFQKKTLYKSLVEMFHENSLPRTFEDWINEIRLVGNSGAHYDPIEVVDLKDAKDMQNFIEEIIRHLYIIPNQLNKRRLNKST